MSRIPRARKGETLRLIQRAQNGNPDAMNTLVKRHSRFIHKSSARSRCR